MTSFRRLVAAAGTVIIIGIPGPSLATPMIDQSFNAFAAGSSGGPSADNTQAVAQTFTVGIAGQLTRMDLQVRIDSPLPDGDLSFNILTTSGGIPTTTSLGGGSVSAAGIPPLIPNADGFVMFDLTALNITVNVGDVLAIELTYPVGAGYYYWLDATGNQYATGEEYVRFPPNLTWSLITGSDAGFQTWVDPTAVAVPEPGTLALFGLGLAGLGFACRRKARRPERQRFTQG